jgi:hypothetical protein
MDRAIFLDFRVIVKSTIIWSADSLSKNVLLLRSSAFSINISAEQPLFVTSQPKFDGYYHIHQTSNLSEAKDLRGDVFLDASSVHECHQICMKAHAACT